MTHLPTLYKKSKSGALQIWEISTWENRIITRFGQFGGAIQETVDIVNKGKNIGKVNETSATQQAEVEAHAKWEKQQARKGYSIDINASDTRAGWSPMLAHKYEDKKDKINFPVIVQPKLDGIRCTWDVESEAFYSRTRLKFRSFPHIELELRALGLHKFPLDGELYNHNLKDNFQEIVSIVKRGETDHPMLNELEYHVYDMNLLGVPMINRLNDYLARIPSGRKIKIVPTQIINSEIELHKKYEWYLNQGYEGAMVRDYHGIYEGHRSNGLLKMKTMNTNEFKIVGIEEGRGKLLGHVGAFECNSPNGLFTVKLKGELKFLKECFENSKLWQGKLMEVQYQGFTEAGLPRFPVGIKIREVGV